MQARQQTAELDSAPCVPLPQSCGRPPLFIKTSAAGVALALVSELRAARRLNAESDGAVRTPQGGVYVNTTEGGGGDDDTMLPTARLHGIESPDTQVSDCSWSLACSFDSSCYQLGRSPTSSSACLEEQTSCVRGCICLKPVGRFDASHFAFVWSLSVAPALRIETQIRLCCLSVASTGSRSCKLTVSSVALAIRVHILHAPHL